MVLDNEAGLENLSRRIMQQPDLLIMAADPSARGLKTVERLYNLAGEMGISYQKLAIVINRLRGGRLPGNVAELKERTGADYVIGLPEDEQLALLAEQGRSLFELARDNPVVKSLDNFLDEIDL